MGLLPLLLRTRPPCGGCSADTAPSTQVLHLTLLYRGRGLLSDIGEHSLLLQQWNGLVNLRLIGSRPKNAEDAWPAAATAQCRCFRDHHGLFALCVAVVVGLHLSKRQGPY